MAKAVTQVFSISALAKLTGLDRATVAKRLDGVSFTEGAKGAKSYRLEDSLPPLISGQSSAYDEAELRKLQADAKLREHKLAVEEGKYVPIAEVESERVKEVQWLNNRLMRLPREAATQLFKSESPEQLEEVLRHQLGIVLNEWREL
jgi:hypothetical protein